MKKATGLAIAVLLAAASCATLSPLYHQGVQSEIAQRWDEAIALYEKAALMNPKEAAYRLALTQVKVKAGLFYAAEARRLLAEGKKDEARAVYDKAQSLDPRNSVLRLEIERAFSPEPKKAEPKPARIEFPIKLKVREGALDLRLSSETSLRAVFQSLARAGEINIVFDETFRDMPFQTDFTNVTFEQALSTICQATKNFSRIIDERTVIIVPDQPAKRLQYEVSCIRTFYLSNANAQDMTASLTNMLRGPAKVPLIFFDKNLNAITIRDTPRTIELAEKLIKLWDKPKGEVIVDIEIMEVNRSRLKELGVSFDNGFVGLRYGEMGGGGEESAAASSWQNLKSLDFGDSGKYFALLPTAYLNFLETDSDTKVIAQPRLRGVADEELHQLVGEKEPVPQTTWNPTAYTTTTTTITSYKYEDVGIDVKFTPKVHYEREVTLNMEIKVTSLGGKGYGDLPRINTREIKSVIRLKDGETTMLTGLLRDAERKSYAGLPILKDIPILGRLFGAEDTTIEQTDIIMTITPHIVRTIPVNPEDTDVLWVDVDAAPAVSRSGGGTAVEPEHMSVDQNLAETARPPRDPAGRGENNSLLLGPSNLDLPAGREFRLTAGVQTDGEIGMISATFAFDPRLLSIKSVASGGIGRALGENAPFMQHFDNNAGTCMVGFNTPVPGKGVRNGGALAVIIFETKTPGEAVVSVSQITAADPQGLPLTFQTGEARIRIR